MQDVCDVGPKGVAWCGLVKSKRLAKGGGGKQLN